MMTTIGVPFLLAMALSLLLVPLCRRASLRLGFIARPRHDRWHRRPVALFGGVAIAAVVFGCAAIFGLPPAHPRSHGDGCADVRHRSGRRPAVPEAVDEAHRPDRARVGAARLRLPPALAQFDHARLAADAVLGRGADQRVQPHRQHGRPLRRDRPHRRHGAADRAAPGRERDANGSPKCVTWRFFSAPSAGSSSTTCTRRPSSWATAGVC